MDESMGQLLNHTSGAGQAEMFSKEWYNEYFRRAEASAAHARFCEDVYGRNLCQHGMMDVEEMDFVVSLLRPGGKTLEIGCSNGYITEYWRLETNCSILGIDYSDVAIAQAQRRTAGKVDGLNFQCVDLIAEDIPGRDYDAIIAVDCIYFMGDYGATIKKLNGKLCPGGRMIVAAFQAREAGDPANILEPDHTRLAQVLKAGGYDYTQYDFTPNICNHWVKNYDFSRSLYEVFAAEGNEFLAEARIAENGWFREHAEGGTLARFVYVIERNPEAAS